MDGMNLPWELIAILTGCGLMMWLSMKIGSENE